MMVDGLLTFLQDVIHVHLQSRALHPDTALRMLHFRHKDVLVPQAQQNRGFNGISFAQARGRRLRSKILCSHVQIPKAFVKNSFSSFVIAVAEGERPSPSNPRHFPVGKRLRILETQDAARLFMKQKSGTRKKAEQMFTNSYPLPKNTALSSSAKATPCSHLARGCEKSPQYLLGEEVIYRLALATRSISSFFLMA